ncbi:flagellar brake protein [Jannaschia sp. R86511]|uniref:flagellar brake protein n=1 Tax=Jannaschia sp. R86511 TaxID=3093853 RepID=UPI0036D22337
MSVDARAGALPGINTPVLVAVPEVDHDLPSRVEDLRGEHIVIAAVTVPGRPERHRQGQVVTLAWAIPPRGLLSVACELVEHERSNPPLWVLRPFGPFQKLQRRRYARADVAARVVVSGEEWTVPGLLADLSEGGARVLLDAGAKLPAEVGDTVVAEVGLPSRPVRTEASLIGVDVLAAGRHQVRLQFDLPEKEAEQVRRAVMQRQLEARSMEDR